MSRGAPLRKIRVAGRDIERQNRVLYDDEDDYSEYAEKYASYEDEA